MNTMNKSIFAKVSKVQIPNDYSDWTRVDRLQMHHLEIKRTGWFVLSNALWASIVSYLVVHNVLFTTVVGVLSFLLFFKITDDHEFV